VEDLIAKMGKPVILEDGTKIQMYDDLGSIRM